MSQISTRKRGNTWEYSFEVAPINGKRKRASKGGFRTKSEALKVGIQAKAEYDSGGRLLSKDVISLNDWLDEWINNLTTKESSRETYEYIVNKHIKPKLGEYDVKTINPLMLQKFFDNLSKEYSSSYVRSIKRVLTGSLNEAYNLEIIKSNPCQNIRIKSNDKYKINTSLTLDEFNKILNCLTETTKYYEIPFKIAWYTGMRRGEICALTWDDIDFENKIIHVNKTETELKNKIMVTPPKTPTSIRDILIGDSLIYLLKNWREQQIQNAKELGITTNKVCTRYSLEPLKPSAIKQYCRTLSNKSNVEFHFHTLRHSHATLLIKNGVSAKEVQCRLGHTSIQTTLDIYSHVKSNDSIESVNVFEMLTPR